MLKAALNTIDFNLREANYGGFPKGNAEGAFFGICRGKMLVGHGKNIFEYLPLLGKWNRIRHEQTSRYNRFDAQGCAVDSMYLLCGDWRGTRVELLKLKTSNTLTSSIDSNNNNTKMKHKIKSYLSIGEGNGRPYPRTKYISKPCPTSLPLDVRYHTITNVGSNKVILVGGWVIDAISNRVFLGELTESKTDVIWKEVESMAEARLRHIAFKMRGSIYVAGGYGNRILRCCERYDLSENRWSRCEHVLPYPLRYASVIVSKDETFAVITGGKTGNDKCSSGIIIFTEDEGFTNSYLSLIHI